MDINVFMTLNDFILINIKLLEISNLNLYRSESYDHPYIKVDINSPSSWSPGTSKSLSLLAGKHEDEGPILNKKQINISRSQRIGFVDIKYGGEDEHAIGASHYGADTSLTAKIAKKELHKILKKYAHANVKNTNGDIVKNHYWTDSALASGKNWHRFIGSGEYKHKNINPGYRPTYDSEKLLQLQPKNKDVT